MSVKQDTAVRISQLTQQAAEVLAVLKFLEQAAQECRDRIDQIYSEILAAKK